jgi:glycosyltransferase involved in cell wall biosynthesis
MLMSDDLALSIVIGFKDWGLERLIANIRLHFIHSPLPIEVIVSDYGSEDAVAVKTAVERVGGRVVRTEAGSSFWNRSAALNAGVKAANASFVITTDADIFFSPNAYQAAYEALVKTPQSLQLVQCRDLPHTHGVEFFQQAISGGVAVDFTKLKAASTLRPRWGMGGLAAFSQASFAALNGYEERMCLWGKEDNDFAKRFRLSGMPVRWLSDKDVNIFHVWHESSQAKASADEEGRRILAENQRILEEDNSRVRNLGSSYVGVEPTVSIVMPTFERNEYLRSAISSCLSQTYRNFELIVVENGGATGARSVVAEFGDRRVRYVATDRKGAAAARNLGNSIARGRYIAIMDDDDLMTSSRIERQLASLKGAKTHGSYGGWIDFDHADGRVIDVNPGKPHSFGNMLTTGRVIMHPTLLLDRRLFKLYPYDEALEAGIDFGLLLKMTFNGLNLEHCGEYVLLRRMHDSNMTVLKAHVQKASAKAAHAALAIGLSPAILDQHRASARHLNVAMTCANEDLALMELRSQLSREHAQRQKGMVDLDAKAIGFDPEWYLATYPDVALLGMDPWSHYVRYGRLLGRSPHSGSSMMVGQERAA